MSSIQWLKKSTLFQPVIWAVEKNCPHTSCFYTIANYFHCLIGYVVNGGLDGKESACNAGGAGSTPGSGKFPGEGNGNPLQYFWTEQPRGLQSMGL